jgi:hypothetical protein
MEYTEEKVKQMHMRGVGKILEEQAKVDPITRPEYKILFTEGLNRPWKVVYYFSK